MMKPLHPTFALLAPLCLAGVLAGCTQPISGESRTGGAPSGSASAPAPRVHGSTRAVEEYLRAASKADGATMYGLIAGSERERESPRTLQDTADDRYSPATRWEILKVNERENTAEVIVDFQGAKVDPNPYRFSLSREDGEWRIIQSPELREEEKRGGIRIKL